MLLFPTLTIVDIDVLTLEPIREVLESDELSVVHRWDVDSRRVARVGT